MNPREHCKAITLRNGRQLDSFLINEGKEENESNKEEKMKDKKEGEIDKNKKEE